jgi:hypothetical protein
VCVSDAIIYCAFEPSEASNTLTCIVHGSKGTPDLRHSFHLCMRCFNSSSGTKSSTVMGSREKGLISLSRRDRSIVTRSMTVPPVRCAHACEYVDANPVYCSVRRAYMVAAQGLPSECPSTDPVGTHPSHESLSMRSIHRAIRYNVDLQETHLGTHPSQYLLQLPPPPLRRWRVRACQTPQTLSRSTLSL